MILGGNRAWGAQFFPLFPLARASRWLEKATSMTSLKVLLSYVLLGNGAGDRPALTGRRSLRAQPDLHSPGQAHPQPR